MQFETIKKPGQLELKIVGDVDEDGADELKKQFAALELEGVKTLVLDFAGVGYIGSAGLGKLLLLYKKMATHGGEVRIENCTSEVRLLLEELNLNSLLVVM